MYWLVLAILTMPPGGGVSMMHVGNFSDMESCQRAIAEAFGNRKGDPVGVHAVCVRAHDKGQKPPS